MLPSLANAVKHAIKKCLYNGTHTIGSFFFPDKKTPVGMDGVFVFGRESTEYPMKQDVIRHLVVVQWEEIHSDGSFHLYAPQEIITHAVCRSCSGVLFPVLDLRHICP